MNARQFLAFFKSKTGQITAFGILFFIAACLLTGVLYFRHGAAAPVTAPNLDKTADKTQQPSSWFSHTPDADYANKHPAEPGNVPSSLKGIPAPPAVLPISLYHGNDQEAEVSDTYAPYGRMIPCETVITIDSAKIETPIIGFVTEDVWHDGKLIIPAGAEVHGKAQVDPSRERIASGDNWILVWRTTDRMNGAELPLHGVALDMERNETTGTWQLTDGSAGLKGDILKTDNWAEIKLFAATFLSAATTGLEDTQTASNALTGQTTETPISTPKNAALAGASAVLNQYAQQILESIKRDGFYVRVPAGKQFYLYVTQTIDLDKAKRGQSLVDLKPENQKP
ncbi:MAG: TrbI/VirB10 family protein [Methylacidiphilales bacterium]|nr:TrbI/VirB10 family protein [Candidatus Methylacidiphilales bacterium]